LARKKKKKPNTPRAKRINRQSRLQSAVNWLKQYDGKHFIRGYRKHYGVDVGTAIAELKILGVPLSDEAIRSAKASAAALVREKAARKEKRQQRLRAQEQFDLAESDETFAYIAGYTNWGFPFGITWEEMERFNDQDSLDRTVPPFVNKKQVDRVDDKDRPYVEVRDAAEVPFDLETFMNDTCQGDPDGYLYATKEALQIRSDQLEVRTFEVHTIKLE